MKNALTTLILLLMAHSVLAGDNAVSMVSVDFSVLPVGQGDFDGVKVEAQPGVVSELKFRRVQRSSPIQYHGPNPIVFFREVPAPSPEDATAIERVLVARYEVPSGIDEALLFFRAAGEPVGSRFSVQGMDDSLEAFPGDSMVAFNATGAPLIARIGEDDHRVRPGANAAVSFREFIDEGIPVGFAVETDDGPKLVFENHLDYAENYRVILMLAPPRRQGSMRLMVYSIPETLGPMIPESGP
ncbi:MAG: hypothetical protein ACQKBV_04020 [Puniceicoccales bacterium]